MKRLLLIVIILVICGYAKGQENSIVYFPKVGDTIVNHVFTDLANTPNTEIAITDFRGKWLIIDFWNYYCTACIASFPKMEQLRQQFKDKVQIIMVGVYSNSAAKSKNAVQKAKNTFNRMKSIHKLKITAAFDSLALKKFDLASVPTILVVNPAGIIVAKTISVNEKQISQLLSGEPTSFKRQFSAHEKIKYNKELPLFSTGMLSNGGNDTSFLFRSLLAPYNYEMPNNKLSFWGENGKKVVQSGKFEIFGVALEQLYFLAYLGDWSWSINHPLYGKYSQNAILQVRDSSAFEVNNITLKGLYAYSLIVPKECSSESLLKKMMRSSLNNYFNYDISIEKRMMPAYHLVVIDPQKVRELKSKSEDERAIVPNKFNGFTVFNQPVKKFMPFFLMGIPDIYTPLIDKTGIDYNLDLSIKADMLNLASINAGLKEVGLKITKGLEEMETFIISDRK